MLHPSGFPDDLYGGVATVTIDTHACQKAYRVKRDAPSRINGEGDEGGSTARWHVYLLVRPYSVEPL